MAHDQQRFVNVVKTFQLNERKVGNSTGKFCEKCKKEIRNDGNKNDDVFSSRDLQNYIYQSSSRNDIHIGALVICIFLIENSSQELGVWCFFKNIASNKNEILKNLCQL